MPRFLFETFGGHALEDDARGLPAELKSKFSIEATAPDGANLTQVLSLGYSAICHGSDKSDRFVLLREGAPIKVGKLRKEGPGSLLQFDRELAWRSDHLLYALGIVTPCLHLGKATGPHWTLLLTALFAAPVGARSKLERLRQKLSVLQRSMAHEVIEDRNPFHTQGATVQYEADTALIAQTTVGLPEEYAPEASAWAAHYPLRSRLYLRELGLSEEFAVVGTENELQHKAVISKHL